MSFILAVLLVFAASGEPLIRTVQHTVINTQEAVSIAACFKATASFTGTNSRVNWCKVTKESDGSFTTDCSFQKPIPLNELTFPVEIQGVDP